MHNFTGLEASLHIMPFTFTILLLLGYFIRLVPAKEKFKSSFGRFESMCRFYLRATSTGSNKTACIFT